METEVIFDKNATHNFHYRKLRGQLKQLVNELPKSRLSFKMYQVVGLPVLYLSIYLLALYNANNIALFYSLYAVLGITAVLIFINIIHDAVHNNFFKKEWANKLILVVFDLLGGNSYIWKKRHVLLHHNFQNVSGWDSDIEQAGLIKIFPNEKLTLLNRHQHWFIFLVYPLYLFNWILIRDFKDFFLSNRMIKKVCKISRIEYFNLFFFRINFIFYMVVLPIMFGVKLRIALVALCVMLVTGSVFALLSLLTPHVNEKSQFPLPDSTGYLKVSWFEHQFITTNDITLNNWFTRNFMGNFNFHLAHHLFPGINSVYAPEVTQEIQKYAKEHGFLYRSYKLNKALLYHYRLIKANALESDFFEEDM